MKELIAWRFSLNQSEFNLNTAGYAFIDDLSNPLEERWRVFRALNLGTVFTYIPFPGPAQRDLTVDATDLEKEWAMENRCFGWNTL